MIFQPPNHPTRSRGLGEIQRDNFFSLAVIGATYEICWP